MVAIISVDYEAKGLGKLSRTPSTPAYITSVVRKTVFAIDDLSLHKVVDGSAHRQSGLRLVAFKFSEGNVRCILPKHRLGAWHKVVARKPIAHFARKLLKTALPIS